MFQFLTHSINGHKAIHEPTSLARSQKARIGQALVLALEMSYPYLNYMDTEQRRKFPKEEGNWDELHKMGT